jgi:hypothetical protein
MPEIDPQIPSSVIKQIREDQPRPELWNEELKDLLNPSIQARPLHIPLSGQIKKRLNGEYEYFWAFDRVGQNPYHERVEQLRAVGFEYATTKDVQMFSEENIKGENEIRSGDRRLMRCPKMRWREIRKDQNLRALAMSNPSGKVEGDGRGVMSAANLVPGMPTYLSEENVDQIRARANTGEGGNASVAKIRKE